MLGRLGAESLLKHLWNKFRSNPGAVIPYGDGGKRGVRDESIKIDRATVLGVRVFPCFGKFRENSAGNFNTMG